MNGWVLAAASQPDGKIIIGGSFTTVGGQNYNRIARLNYDGTVDSTFDIGTGANTGEVTAVAVESDGQVLIGGTFTEFAGVPRPRIARLQANGNLDVSFAPGDGANGIVQIILPLAGGEMLIGGNFSRYDGQPVSNLVRAFADGTLNLGFFCEVNGPVLNLAAQPDGRWLVGGDFTEVNGLPRVRLARIQDDGSVLATFDPGAGPNAAVASLVVRPDGRTVVGGVFGAVGSLGLPYFCLLNAEGIAESPGLPRLNGPVYAMALQGDGKLVVGGAFSDAGGVPALRLTRLREDGAVDPSFEVGTGANGDVRTVTVQPDGGIVIGGGFNEINGQSHPYLARIEGLSVAVGGDLDFSAATYKVSEGGGSLEIEVRRTGSSTVAVQVDYATSNGTATGGPGRDFTPTGGKLDFASGDVSKKFTVAINPDNLVEDDETVLLNLRNPTGGARLGSLRTATLVIINDDAFVESGGVDLSRAAWTDNAIEHLALQPDGKTLVVGHFTVVNGLARTRVARLNADGTLDAGFSPTLWTDGPAFAVAVRSNGKILLGGSFQSVNGVTRRRLAQLHADGTLDERFDPGAGPNNEVYALAVLATGDVLAGGAFEQYAGAQVTALAKVLEDGSVDTSYSVELNGAVTCIAPLAADAGGRILVGGNFTQLNGVARPGVARLGAQGELDQTFNPAALNGAVSAIAVDGNGRVLVGGNFYGVFSDGRYGYLCRLTADGPLDMQYLPAVSGQVETLALQPDGKLVVGGVFISVNGEPRNRLVRLREDGSLDPAFNVGTGANDWVSTVLLAPDGAVVAGGRFTEFGGLTRKYLAWLQGSAKAPGGELEFVAPTYRANEGLGEAPIEVRRTGDTNVAVEVEFATGNGTATLQDYSPASGLLLFATGQTSQTFRVTLKPDPTVEEDETVLLTLRNPGVGGILGSQRTATLVIANDDAFQAAGGVDVAYRASANGGVYALVEQSDGRVVVAGEFTGLNGESRQRLTRLKPDGTLDRTFAPGLWVEGVVQAATLQADGKIVVGGSFMQVNGTTRNRLARVHPDGSLDDTFDPGSGPNSTVLALAMLGDGTLLVGGSFDRYGVAPVTQLAKVYWDGSLDTTYSVDLNGAVLCIRVLAGDGLLIGGNFTRINGRERVGVARLLPDGTVDERFVPARLDSASVSCLLPDREGRVLVGGGFYSVWGDSTFRYLCRLTPEGSLDFTFRPGVDGGGVQTLVLQGDDKLVLGGDFTMVGGQTQNRLARLRADATLDPSFETGTGANGYVRTILQQRDESLLLGGGFTHVNGLARGYLARLKGISGAVGGELEFSAATFRASEGVATAEVEVRRTGNSGVVVEVDYTTANGTATAPDYFPASGSLQFAAGDVSKRFTVTLRPDAVVEDDETVLLTLRNPAGGAVLGSQQTATLFIVNDDEFLTAGGLDTAYPAWANGPVQELVPLADGRLLVAGSFTCVNGVGRLRLARLDADGLLDPAFDPSLWANDSVSAAEVLPDGKIVIGGSFTLVNGVTRNRLARLRPDGRLDETFDPGAGPDSTVNAVVALSSGDVVVGGGFTRYAGLPATYLARVLDDGTLDTGYVVNLNGAVWCLSPADGNQLYVGGDFTLANDLPRARLVRLHPDGTVDAAFTPPAFNTTVAAVVPDRAGRVVVGGSFSYAGGEGGYPYLCRLSREGPLDYGFRPRVNGPVAALAMQRDDKLVLVGSFSSVNDQPRSGVARLRTDGSLDPAFEVGSGANSWVGSVVLQTDGTLLIGGNFTAFNGLSRPYLARLQSTSAAPGGEIEFGSAVIRAAEDSGRADVEVRRTGSSALAVEVECATANGTATLLDYLPASTNLTFGVGDLTKTFQVTLKPDTTVEDDETVSLTLRNATGGAVLGSQRTATLVIVNDDDATGPGSVDLAFTAAANGPVYAAALQPDGKVIVGGDFLAVNGAGRARIARLNPDGSLDAGFDPGLTVNATVHALALAADGKVLLGGAFSEVAGTLRYRLARLNLDGTLDTSFDPWTGPDGTVLALATRDDGSALVGGSFGTYAGTARPYLLRVLANGALDAEWSPGPNGPVYVLHPGRGGQTVVGGAFTSMGNFERPYVARLNADLTADTGFSPPGGPNSYLLAAAMDTDGRTLIGGQFTWINNSSWNRLARLLPGDGTPDTGLAIGDGANDSVQAIAVQPDGGVIVGGRFTAFSGRAWNRLVRLKPDGAVDNQFAVGSAADATVWTIQALADGGLIVGGEFTQFNGLTRERLVRLRGSTLPPAAFHLQSLAYEGGGLVRLLLSGRTGQKYVMQVSTDLETWRSLSTNTAPAGLFEHLAPTVDPQQGVYRTLSVP